ncbi:MAG: methyltransferase [Saccharothrix sp.]|nr:methyltransferase [Saccharothrix sp.]
MPVALPDARTRLSTEDHVRLRDAVALIRDRGTVDALRTVAPEAAATLEHRLEFVHGALLLVTDDVPVELAELGVRVRSTAPSVVVRDRLARRLGRRPGDLDVRIVHGVVDGGPRELELFLLAGHHPDVARQERRHEHESHLAFRVRAADEVAVRGVHAVLLDAGMEPDGGGYNRHEDVTALYFRGRGRLELRLAGRHDVLLRRHGPDQAQRTVLDLATGAWRTQAVAVAAELGIADLLAGGPRSTAELAHLAGARVDNLHRLLRLLACHGVFRQHGDRWALTDVGAMLRSDVPGSQRDLTRAYGTFFYRAFELLAHTVRTGGCAFTEAFSRDPFDHFAAHPDDARVFAGAMAAGSTFFDHLAEALDLPRDAVVVDVGGGDGRLLGTLLAATPGARGVLYDLPHAIASAGPALTGCADRTTLVAGDFFTDPLPRGDVYVLSRVLHDWDDDRCATILRNVRAAAPAGATLVVVERPIPDDHLAPLPLGYDVHMMVNNVRGRERTLSQYRDLLHHNGFTLDRHLPLPLDMAALVATALTPGAPPR